MLNTEAVLKYSQKLSVLYICTEAGVQSSEKLLRGFFKTVQSSSNRTNDVKIYIDYKEKYGRNVDIVIIDSTAYIELCSKILKIFPNQKIILSIESHETNDLFQFIEIGITNFTLKPLSIMSLSESIYGIYRDKYHPDLLIEYASRYKAQKKEKDILKSAYENKLLDMQCKVKEKSNFLATISHEIRTPMNAIIGLSHIMLNESELSSHQLDYIGKINRSSKMLLGIINDTLDYSKIEAGKLNLENIEFDINMVLEHVADMIGLKAQEKELDLVFDVDHNVPSRFIGDPLRISQILLNLLSNAVKFTDSGSVILKVSRLDDAKKSTIQFEVSDTGIGLTDEQINNLFQSYSQAEDSTSRRYGGTGLGLMISKQLAELMNGHIWIESEYGKSTTFFVSIVLDVNERDQRRSYHLPSKELMQKRILIIDSHIKSSISLSHMLGYYHMPIQCVNSIEHARELLIKDSFDIIYIDEKLNISDDIEMFQKNSIPKIVLVQERKYESHTNSYSGLKIDTYLTKPFNQQMVFDTILRLYNHNKNITHIEKKHLSKGDLITLGKRRILLAEDNQINQRVIQGLLDRTELDLIFANNGQEALDFIKTQEAFDIIFMDVQMPIMNGYEATKKIRQDSAYDSIPIIAMTADVMPEDIKKAKDHGMQGHLAKPIDVSSLYELMFKYLKVETIVKKADIKEDLNGDCYADSYRLLEVPELNYKSTLRRMGNDTCLYNSLIIDFITQYKNSAKDIVLYIKDKNFIAGGQYIHDIRIAAANIGAKTVFKESKVLEYAFIKKDLPLLRKHLQNYNSTMQKFIKLMENTIDIKDSKESVLSDELNIDLLKLLDAAKNKHVTDIVRITEELRHKKWPKVHNRAIYEIIDSIKQYDFKKVVTQLEGIGIK